MLMSMPNKRFSFSGPSEHQEVVVVGSDIVYPSRNNSDITWSNLPFFRVTNTANFRGAETFKYTPGDFEVDDDGLVLSTDTVKKEEKRNFFARLLSVLYLKVEALGKRLGVFNCTPA